MADLFDAIYEDGVLKPVNKLDLREHQQVQIAVYTTEERTANDVPTAAPEDPLDGLRVATGIADLTRNFDEYRFGIRY